MTKKIKRPKRLLLTAFVFLMCLLLCTASVFGAVAQEVRSVRNGDVAAYEFADQGGDLGKWNSKEHAFMIGEDYAYGIIPGDVTSSAVTNGKKYLYNGSAAPDGMIRDTQFTFNLTKAREEEGSIPDLTIVYSGYKIYDDEHAFRDDDNYVHLEIHATVKAANLEYNQTNDYPDRALVAVNKKLFGGICRVHILNIGTLQMKYDFYAVQGSTKEKYKVLTNFTYRDVDGAQGIAFKDFGLDYEADPLKIKAASLDSRMHFGVDDDWYIFNGSSGGEDSGTARNAFGVVSEINGTGYITYISGRGDPPVWDKPRGKLALFAPSTYSWFSPMWADPRKTVSDNNEKFVLANTVENINNATWTYDISQEVPNGLLDAYYPSEFEIRDTLDTCLKIDKVYVDHRNGGEITPWFDISIDHATNEVVAKAKPSTLTNPVFYGDENGNTIRLHIDVTLDVAKSEASGHGHMTGDIWTGLNGVQNGNNPTPASRRIVYVNGTENTAYTNEVTTSTGQGDPTPPGPAEKTVSDNDESDTTANMLTTPDERYTYSIDHALPAIWPEVDPDTGEEGDMPYYQSYEFTDTLEDILRPISAKVMSGGTDVSEDFHISINGQKVTATMTQPALVTDDSYGRDYSLVIETELRTDEYYTPAHLAPWLSDDGVTLTIPNDALVVAVDSEGTAYESPTDDVVTIVDLPTISYENDPGIEIHKSVEPYEFQIKDEIPYKITFQQNNPDATAMDVVIRDDTMPRGLNIKPGSIKVSGISRAYTCEIIEGGLELKTKYLDYGDTVTIDFIAIAEKNLNGQVIPNEVTASAWGVPDNSDSTTIYLNSPKIDVEKKVSKQGHSSINNTINYEVSIKQIHPGCFMRDIWFEDEILTDGVELEKGSFSVSDTDGNVLALNTDYTLNIKDNKFKIVFTKGNMGYHDTEAEEGDLNPYIPTWDDPRGQNAKYYFKRDANSDVTDYENLELQKEYVITYSVVVDDSVLGGREIKNHAVVPSTENTNGDVIRDDPNIPSGGGEDEVIVLIDGPNLIPDKEADKREYNVDEMAEYTLTVGLDGADMTAEDVVITDRFQQEGIAILSSDTIRVHFNNTDITWQCRITPDDDLQGFTIETGRDLTQKDRITVQYLAEIVGDGVLDNTMSAEATNAPKAEWDNDIIVTPMPELKLAKTSDKEVYTIGETGTYKVKVDQIVPGAVAKKIVIDDSITEEGVLIDKESFKVMLNDDDITDKCIIKAEDRSFKIETRRNMTSTDEIVVTYDVLFTDDAMPGKVYNVAYAVSDNTPEVEAEHEIELKEVPPELDIVKTSDKKIYALGEIAEYTVTATQTKEHAVARGVVLKDGFTYGGMQIVPDSIKVMKGDVDITKGCTIDTAKRSFKIDTKKDLKYNESITVTYLVQFNSIKLTDAQIGVPQPEQDTTTGAETDMITGPDVDILAGPEAELVDGADGYAHNIVTVDAENAPEEETEHIVSLREPELKIIKKAEKRRYDVGDTGTYTLTVKQRVRHGIATDVVIKDKFKKKGMEIKLSDIKVKKGKKDITKTCKITMNGKNGFTIRTGQDLAYGEEMTVTYKVLFKDEALKGKKLKNVAIAKAKNADEVKTDEEVKISGMTIFPTRPGSSGGSGPATGDDSKGLVVGCIILLLLSAGVAAKVWRSKRDAERLEQE